MLKLRPFCPCNQLVNQQKLRLYKQLQRQQQVQNKREENKSTQIIKHNSNPTIYELSSNDVFFLIGGIKALSWLKRGEMSRISTRLGTWNRQLW